MKKIFIILLLILQISCSKTGETIKGEILSYTPLRPGLLKVVLLNVPKGYLYMIKNDIDGKYYGLYHDSNILREGDVGFFQLGAERFSGSFEEPIVIGQKTELIKRRFTVYKVKSYELSKRGEKQGIVIKIIDGFKSKFVKLLLDKAFK